MRRKFAYILLLVAIPFTLWAISDLYGKVFSDFIARDFFTYWPSGRLLLAGQNPYSSDALFALQKGLGWVEGDPLLTYNPPWAMVFILPFCLKNFIIGKLFWIFFDLSLLLTSVFLIWRFYGGVNNFLWSLLVVVFFFPPTAYMMKRGQIVPLVLLGIIAFLWLERNRKYFLAGLVLTLVSVKPHIAYLFWLALLLWVLDRRRCTLLLGAGFGALVATIPALLFNPNIFSQYLTTVLNHSPIYYWGIPSVGTFLRLLFGGKRYWLQFLSVVVATAWFLFYWREQRRGWAWDNQMPLILLISTMTTYYIWVSDYILLLPVIIQGLIWFLKNKRNISLQWLVTAYSLGDKVQDIVYSKKGHDIVYSE
jgi:hypothetical protein